MPERVSSKMSNEPRNTNCFSEDSLAKLMTIMYVMNLSQGSRLFWEYDKADKLYYIKQGHIRITKSSDDGRHFVLYMYQKGDLFGQVDPFRTLTQGFNAEAVEDSIVGVIQQQDLEILLWQHGELAMEFMKWMSLVHRMTQTKFRDLMMFGKTGALCSVIIRLVNAYGVQEESGIRIARKLTNTDLAEMIGATRESVNRMLGDMKKHNAIDFADGYLIVHDQIYLKDICHCENCSTDICRM